ncbi:hypothetical protein JH06_4770 [Blastocystis sp. subtype 4]|uniref:hypothetical protein n=1 Tax=Blastocystis sp. subtype 4 TaxID=944170 RepID=UPI0007113761|nr:hypothetical protein JH06_4770 [Blastocystis sp. subtype 4]KNB45441.1 hypothetical protein JH06_4770 [Blastocystis sp. subtype 4]|eukprot:XP_014528890.1 hypothetical protein JH06_4770 [Blastocystis sp. subtype 4]
MPRPDSKVMLQPIDTRVQIWLFDQTNIRIEGQIKGFDEYMNIVLDSASEVNIKMKTRKNLGRILLKGDNVTLIQELN